MGGGPDKARSANSRFVGVWSLALTMLAILLWGKLKLVTGVPRTAYADPKAAVISPRVEKPATTTTRMPADRPDLVGD